MLSFFQSSRNRATPIFLYDIVYGGGNGLYLTDSEVPISWFGHEYLPVPIEHSEVKTSGSLDNTKLELRCAINNPLTALFINYPPERTTTLVIRQGDAGDPDGEFTVIWSGRILGFSADNIEGKFDCEPIGTATRRPGLRRNFQYGCPHVLYGPMCKANMGAATVTSQVKAISGSVIRFNSGWNGALPADKFIGGMARWGTPQTGQVTRTILRAAFDGGAVSFTLNGAPTGLRLNADVDLIMGCNHRMDDCKNLHNNIVNYGGQPWIPLKNPIGSYNNFY